MLSQQDAAGRDELSPSATAPFAPEALRLAPLGGAAPLAPDDGEYECEEMLIVDERANLGPAQLVEHKLSTLLGGALLPVSHVRMLSHLGNRNHC
jgi:hypothetical protein